jgi:hypothetical protein
MPAMSKEQQETEVAFPRVEVPTLKSLYLETYFGEQLLSSATGFLIARTRESHCTLLTNRHVVTGRHQESGACLSKHAALPDALKIYFHKDGADLREWKSVRLPLYRVGGEPFWIEHPRLEATADVVALNLKWGSDVTKYPYYLDEKLDRVNMFLSPADAVSVIGFPFGLSSYGRFPVWATGSLAQDLDLVQPERPAFFIDCRSRQGQSGSPVVAFRSSGARTIKDGRINVSISADPTWEFLGIYSGRVNPESDLGVVWHVSALGELVDAAETDMRVRDARHAQLNAGAPAGNV